MATTKDSSLAGEDDHTVLNIPSGISSNSSSPLEIQNDVPTGSADLSSPLEIQIDAPTGSADSPPLENRNDTATGYADSSVPLVNQNENNRKLYLELQKAALQGNVEKAKKLVEMNSGSNLLSIPITEEEETVFHVAAGAKHALFVKEMINLIEQDQVAPLSTLKEKNKAGNTAFCLATMAGSKSIAEIMLEKDPELLTIRGGQNMTPLYLATLFGHEAMALELYERIKKVSTAEEILDTVDKQLIFSVSIDNTLYGLALEMLKDDEENELAGSKYKRDIEPLTELTPLRVLAQTPLHLLDQTSESGKTTKAVKLLGLLWEKILEKEGREIWTYFSTHKDLLFEAAQLGNFIFLEELIQLYPDLVIQTNDKGQSIFHIAIIHRHVRVFDLVKTTGFNKQFVASCLDKDKNSLLHLAARYDSKERPVRDVPGAALEMQQELIIFKDVESLVMPSYKVLKNSHGKTPRELFSEDHAELFKKGEEWMQRTANSCMIVATLIATVVFSAASSVPSVASSAAGNDEEGITKNTAFHIFAITDAIALCFSSISILIFLSILTSRYKENDFLRSLPLKLVAGVLTLFIAIASMMVSFILIFFIVYKKDRDGIRGTIIAIGIVPVFLFGVIEYRLLKDIFYSSFRFRFFY